MPPVASAAAPASPALEERFERLPLTDVVASKTNPRSHFDESYLGELAASIAEKGLVQPIIVRPNGKRGTFEIVAGECRFRASKLAKQTHIAAVIRSYTDEQVLEMQLIENIHRKDLTALEQARGYRALIDSNPTKHSAESIATRIGMSPAWVWDRMKLLDLIPEAQRLLEEGRISVAHAIPIARLTAEQQKRVIHPDTGGLFEHQSYGLFDERPKSERSKLDDYKPRTVREVQDWIANHIRFDVTKMAQAAPLEFEATATKVAAAAQQSGRGKKVVPITFDHVCPYNAKDDNERTYGQTAWKRADGQEGSKKCDHAVMGVVAAGGERYGDAFEVCIARDKCLVHWAESVRAKQKAAKLRERGETKKAAKVEKKQQESYEAKWQREQAERNVREKAWGAIATPVLADALVQAKAIKQLTPALAKAIEEFEDIGWRDVRKHLGAAWFKTPATALVVSAVAGFHFHAYGHKDSGFDRFVKEIAKPLGLDIKRLTAVRDKHQPKPVQALGVKPGKKAKRAA